MTRQTAITKMIIGCDHAAFDMKERICSFLNEKHIAVTDVGTDSSASVDYPDFGGQVAQKVAVNEFERGILLCGSGIGMSITANRFKGVRAALCHDVLSAQLSRLHNDANILVLGARLIGDVLALKIVETWLETPFEGGRHQKRITKIDCLT